MKIFLLLPTSIDLNHILMTLAQVIVELVTAGEASGLELTAWDRAEEAWRLQSALRVNVTPHTVHVVNGNESRPLLALPDNGTSPSIACM